MYQNIIYDPGGEGPIRIVDCTYDTIVDGSILNVPADTKAYLSIRGEMSDPYPSGSWEIFTGESPFFVRLRHLMTRGDPGVPVLVFYVSCKKRQFLPLGIEDIPFVEKRFHLTMNAFASCHIVYHIDNASLILEKVVGQYSTSFSKDDLEPSLREVIRAPIHQQLSRYLSEREIVSFNQHLLELSAAVKPSADAIFRSAGLSLDRLDITGITISDEDRQRLQEMEDNYSKGITETDLELDHLKRIFGGDIDKQMLSEMLTGMPSRGITNRNLPPVSNGGSPMNPMIQMMMFSQLMPSLRENISSLTRHTDRFGNASGSTGDGEPETGTSRPLPSRFRRCPSCNGEIERGLSVCPICGEHL